MSRWISCVPPPTRPWIASRVPRSWVERRFTDLRYWSEPAVGGHFASMEQPEVFVDEVRAFFRLVR